MEVRFVAARELVARFGPAVVRRTGRAQRDFEAGVVVIFACKIHHFKCKIHHI